MNYSNLQHTIGDGPPWVGDLDEYQPVTVLLPDGRKLAVDDLRKVDGRWLLVAADHDAVYPVPEDEG